MRPVFQEILLARLSGLMPFKCGRVRYNRTKLAVAALYDKTLPSGILKISNSSAATISILSLSQGFYDDAPVFDATTCDLYVYIQDIEAIENQGQLKETVVSSTLVPTVMVQNDLVDHRLAKSSC